MKHACHAIGCCALVRPELLMCKRHWAFVPESVKRRVQEHYRADKKPSAEWTAAANEAREAVAQAEGVSV